MNEIEQQLEDLRGQWKGETDPEKKKAIESQADSLKCRHILDNNKRCDKPRRNWDSFSCQDCYDRLSKGGVKGRRTIAQVQERIKQIRRERFNTNIET